MKEIVKDVGHWIKDAFNTVCEWLAYTIAVLLFVATVFVTLYIALNTSCVPVNGQATACVFTDSDMFIQKLSE